MFSAKDIRKWNKFFSWDKDRLVFVELEKSK